MSLPTRSVRDGSLRRLPSPNPERHRETCSVSDPTNPNQPFVVVRPAPRDYSSILRLRGVKEIKTYKGVEPDWIVPGLICAGTVNVVVAAPKVGKSAFCRAMAAAVAAGTSFLGREPLDPARTVYLALEEDETVVFPAFERLLSSLGAPDDVPLSVMANAPPADAVQVVADMIVQDRPRLVVVDPLIYLLQNLRDIKDYSAVSHELAPLLQAAKVARTAVVLCHHTTKIEYSDTIKAPLGSGNISGVSGNIIVLRIKPDDTRTMVSKGRLGQYNVPETALRLDPETQQVSVMGGAPVGVAISTPEFLPALQEIGPCTSTQLREHTHARMTTVDTWLRQAVADGIVTVTRAPGRGGAKMYMAAIPAASAVPQPAATIPAAALPEPVAIPVPAPTVPVVATPEPVAIPAPAPVVVMPSPKPAQPTPSLDALAHDPALEQLIAEGAPRDAILDRLTVLVQQADQSWRGQRDAEQRREYREVWSGLRQRLQVMQGSEMVAAGGVQ